MNHELSTISLNDLIPEATRAIERYTKRTDVHSILTRYDTHLSTEDLVMETVEKVLNANPEYLTKTYVWLSAKSVCINKCQKKRIITVDVGNPFGPDSEDSPILEHEILGDTYDHIKDCFDYIVPHLSEDDQALLRELLNGGLYIAIADNLGVSLRTLERRVADLKWKVEYLLSEEDPDVNPLVY
jgi:DNA-directed RNA polymerase specialized sigma24 family protein